MAKRFTDNTIWNLEWFMNLHPAEKTAFFYVKDQCDSVGVWTPNFKLADFHIGCKIDWEKLKERCNGNIETLDNGKWWIIDFCCFQYGNLTEETSNKAHLSYIKLLKKHDLWDKFVHKQGACMGHASPLWGHKEKEKEMDKEKEKKRFVKPTIKQIQDYINENNIKGIDAKYFYDSNESKGWVVGKFKTPMKSWKSTINTWVQNDKKDQKNDRDIIDKYYSNER